MKLSTPTINDFDGPMPEELDAAKETSNKQVKNSNNGEIDLSVLNDMSNDDRVEFLKQLNNRRDYSAAFAYLSQIVSADEFNSIRELAGSAPTFSDSHYQAEKLGDKVKSIGEKAKQNKLNQADTAAIENEPLITNNKEAVGSKKEVVGSEKEVVGDKKEAVSDKEEFKNDIQEDVADEMQAKSQATERKDAQAEQTKEDKQQQGQAQPAMMQPAGRNIHLPSFSFGKKKDIAPDISPELSAMMQANQAKQAIGADSSSPIHPNSVVLDPVAAAIHRADQLREKGVTPTNCSPADQEIFLMERSVKRHRDEQAISEVRGNMLSSEDNMRKSMLIFKDDMFSQELIDKLRAEPSSSGRKKILSETTKNYTDEQKNQLKNNMLNFSQSVDDYFNKTKEATKVLTEKGDHEGAAKLIAQFNQKTKKAGDDIFMDDLKKESFSDKIDDMAKQMADMVKDLVESLRKMFRRDNSEEESSSMAM